MIRAVLQDDIPALTRLYNYYVENSITTFEEVPVNETEMAHRIAIVSRNFPWLVWEEAGEIHGFAYANYWKARSAYRFTLETTIYLSHKHLNKGIGRRLYSQLLYELRLDDSLHRFVACISLPNDASVRLHESLGYQKIAHFSEVGFKQGQWIDVGYWELKL